MLAKLSAGYRRTDTKPAILGCDQLHPVDPLDVDDQLWLDHTRTQLNKNIRAACEHTGEPGLGL
jgi:hypothetical protein